uniref:Uncharacterized protein n=1 Tax=Ditylenchus dipsaci TaxID=166011 RepID=A0A915EPG7_9BILA
MASKQRAQSFRPTIIHGSAMDDTVLIINAFLFPYSVNNLIEHVRAHPESVLTGHSMSSFPLLKKSTSTTTLNDSISSETLGVCSSQHEWDQSGSTPKAAFQLTHKAEMSPSPAVVGQVAPEEAMPTTFAGLFEAAIREYCPQLLENGPSENLTGIPWMFKEALSEYAPHLLRF